MQTLAPSGVRTIDRSGGTVLHTSRTNPAAVRHKDAPAHLKAFFADPAQKHDFTAQVLANLSQLAIEAAAAGKTGVMVALQKGCYTTVDIDVVTGGAKRVDVAAFYDEDHYRPHIRSLGGKPMFLY